MMVTAPIPDHVPPDLVRDVDIFNILSYGPDIHLAFKTIQARSPPLLYTPRNGGHWLPTSAEVIERVFSDHETFISSGAWVPPNPPGLPPQIPIQADGELHRGYRSLIMPFLVGKSLHIALQNARRLAIDLIESFIDKGTCDFATDFAQHLPIQVFLDLVELPSQDRAYLVSLAEIVRIPDERKRLEAFGKLMAYLQKVIDERTAKPGDDLISSIIKGKIGGRPMTSDEILGECTQVMIGGLDTVASMMGFIAAHLAVNVPLRRRLAAEPELIKKRIDEIMRRFGVAGPARQVAKDVTINGIFLKAGDPVFIAAALHGLDDHLWNNSLEIDLDRNCPATQYQTFGSGPHRCPGAALARNEIILFLEEWLQRIPDFSLVPGKPMISGSGSVNGVLSLQLQWDVPRK